MRTRTNLHLDNDAFEIASFYADARGLPLGAAVSEIIRRIEQGPEDAPRLVRNEHGWLVKPKSGRVVTAEMVKQFSEDDAE